MDVPGLDIRCIPLFVVYNVYQSRTEEVVCENSDVRNLQKKFLNYNFFRAYLSKLEVINRSRFHINSV